MGLTCYDVIEALAPEVSAPCSPLSNEPLSADDALLLEELMRSAAQGQRNPKKVATHF